MKYNAFWAICLVLVSVTSASAQHICDTQAPLTAMVIVGVATVQACWTGLDQTTPPQAIANPTWHLVIDNSIQPIVMTKTGTASATGAYLYTGTAPMPIGEHTVSVSINDGPTGVATPANMQVKLTVTPVPNKAPVVTMVSTNQNTQVGIGVMLSATATDDNLPLAISPDGLRIPNATQIVDVNYDVWTLEAGTALNRAILKNGVQASLGFGSRILFNKLQIYALGDDLVTMWYVWNGTIWTTVGADPGPTTVPIIPPHLTPRWSSVSGPGTTTFTNPTSWSTNASFSMPGTYISRLTASDGSLSGFADVTTVVVAAPQPALVVTNMPITCKFTVTGTPPDAQAGWNFQALYGNLTPTNALGAQDNTAPYSATVNLGAGTYKVAARWTRSGSTSVTTPTQTMSCP